MRCIIHLKNRAVSFRNGLSYMCNLLLKLDDEQAAVELETAPGFPTLVNSFKETPYTGQFVISLAMIQKRRSTLRGDNRIVWVAHRNV
jgi:hypothetical protein